MARAAMVPTGVERFFGEDELIVSKTDVRGRIIYANDVFRRVSGFREPELMTQPHSMIRHPDMPRAVFRVLWDGIAAGREVFAYVVNLCANGDHYWVFAHVTPTLGEDGGIVGYHSSRRQPTRTAVDAVRPLYAQLRQEETRHPDPRQGLEASCAWLENTLRQRGQSYDEFVFSL